jgi:hypothetical protein
MKEDAETTAAKSLNKEYLLFKKYATRPDVPKLESDYFNNMASSTARKIDWDLLKPKKKVDHEESEDEGYRPQWTRQGGRGKAY